MGERRTRNERLLSVKHSVYGGVSFSLCFMLFFLKYLEAAISTARPISNEET